jgi:DNA-binding phage protein
MKDRDHNEAMAGMFQAEPRFAADYLRQVLADGEPADVRAGLRQMADVLRVSQAAPPTDSRLRRVSLTGPVCATKWRAM